MTDPTIDEIKSRIDIVDLISNYITLKQAGANFKGLCPFHGEKTPSFMVNRQRQIFRCFGCGVAGDIFEFIQKQENIDFPNALRLLADKAGVTLPERSGGKKGQDESIKPDLYMVNAVAAKFFHQVLLTHPSGREALDYLKKRGVSEESVKTFQIGYAPAGNSAVQTVLKRYSLPQNYIAKAGSPERFRDRIMFPFRDVIGRIVGFSGRALHDQMPKYLNTSETELFRKNRYLYGLYEGKKAIGQAQKVILVEGQLDLVLAYQAGTQYTVAPSGTALTDDHLRIIRRYSDVLHLALDGDAAGKKATERAISMALSHGFDIAIIFMPEGIDPGEMIANQPDVWNKAISKPMPAIDWLFIHFFPDVYKPTASELTHIFNTLFPYIAKQADNTISQTYNLQRLGIRLGIKDERVIIDAFEKWQKESLDKKEKRISSPQPSKSLIDSAEEEQTTGSEEQRRERNLIGLLFIRPDLFGHSQLSLNEKDFTSKTYSRLYTLMYSWYNSTTDASAERLIHYVETRLPKAAMSALQKLLFEAQTNVADLAADQLLQEYSFLVQTIRQRQRDERIQTYADLIAQAEADNDRVRVLELMQHMQTALKQKEFHAKEDS